MPAPVRYPGGINNALRGADPRGIYRNLPTLVPHRVAEYFNDFYDYAAGDFTITQTGGTAALVDGDGGQIALVASTGGTDSIFLQHPKLSWYPEAGKQMWFSTRLKMDAVTTGNMIIGLVAQDTTPLTNTDGIYFTKPTAGTGAIDFIVRGSSTSTTASAVTTLAANTFTRLGFYYNGKDGVEYFVDGLKIGTSAITTLPSAGLTLTLGVAATSVVARTLTLDYTYVSKERFTPASP